MARRQLPALGWTPAQARQRVITGHWVGVLPGVYATFTGRPDELARIWAALLHAGDGATATHQTSLWLAGALNRPPEMIHVAVEADRKVRPPAWVRLHRKRNLEAAVHPGSGPPRTRLEVAVLDCCDLASTANAALGLIFQVTQRRLTTAGRLRAALAQRSRHRWRSLLTEVLAEVEDGVASPLERRYARDVERRHGLPSGERTGPRPIRAAGPGIGTCATPPTPPWWNWTASRLTRPSNAFATFAGTTGPPPTARPYSVTAGGTSPPAVASPPTRSARSWAPEAGPAASTAAAPPAGFALSVGTPVAHSHPKHHDHGNRVVRRAPVGSSGLR